jgi:photosystem II stability/assembly factor-like uncharacterized protein
MKKNIVLIIGFLFFSCSFAQTINNTVPYEWQIPSVQGHHLNDTKWLPDNRILAVGDQGTILISSYSGANWQVTQLPIVANFYGLDYTDSLTFYVAGGDVNNNGQIYKTMDGGQSWALVFDSPTVTIRGIDFVNDSTGFAVAKTGKIIKTTDAGQTWSNLTTGTVNNFTCVQFLNSDTGYAGGDNFGLYRTDNGGNTWSQVIGCPTNNIYCMQFVNDTLGWMGAFGGTILRTFNGGLNWVQQFTQNNSQKILKISMNGVNTGIAVSNSYVYRTSNGVNWNAVFNTSQFSAYCVALNSNSDIFFGGQGGSMYSAANFGSTYTDLNPDMGLSTNSKIRFFDPMNGWVSRHEGKILRTTNGGTTWLESSIPSGNSMNDLAIISANKIIAVGVNGTVVTSVNGGVTLSTQQMTSTNDLMAISFPTATTGYIAGISGTLYKTTNGGTAWNVLNSSTTGDIMDLHFLDNNIGYFLTSLGSLKKTINGGTTWTDINITGFFLTPFKSMWWIDQDTGMVVNSSGILGRTTDGGQTWNTIPSFCSGQTYDLVFNDNFHGYAVGHFNFSTCDISYTENAGQSWSPINLPFKYEIYGIHAFDSSNFYVCTSTASILHAGSSVVTESTKNATIANAISLQPNPANENVLITKLHKSSKSSIIQLLDVSGRLIQSISIEPNVSQVVLDLNGLMAGIYFVNWNETTVKLLISQK